MKCFLGAVAGVMLFLSLNVQAEGDPAAGEAKSITCAACHGADGNSVVAMWPKIAGQHESYLNRQITLIKSGDRPVPEMMGIVASLSEQDIADLSAYYAAQTTAPGAADEALVAAGERLYRAGNADEGIPACMSCHGPAGEGNPLAGYPQLAGQHATYTASMLRKFHDGQSWGEEDANSQVMVGVAKALTDEEILAVASYIEGLYFNAD